MIATGGRPMLYQTAVVGSLSAFSDDELDAVTRQGSVQHDWRYLRACEATDLAEACRGPVDLRFVTVTAPKGAGRELVGLCPFLVTRSPDVVYPYSLQKLYFTGWQDQLLRINPEAASWIGYARLGTRALLQVARRVGISIAGAVLVTSPLGMRGGVATRAGENVDRIHQAVLQALQGVARAERLPLCVNAIAEDDPFGQSLERAGFTRTFFMFDHETTIGAGGLDGYLQRFNPKIRRNFRAEMRLAAKNGYRVELVRDLEPWKDAIAAAYDETNGKYGTEYFVHPPGFWATLTKTLGDLADVYVVTKDGRFAGFTLLLHKNEEMFVYRLGRHSEADGEEPKIYFDLLTWLPVKRALELGVTRIWQGTGAWEAKRFRGAELRPLYRHFWFPSARSRLLLAPFVKFFGKTNRAQIEKRLSS